MSFLFEIIALGLKNLQLHLLRTILTALGIILGVAAVIVMVSLGEGTKKAALLEIDRLGAKNIIIRSQKAGEEQRQQSGRRAARVDKYGITREDLEVIRENFPDTTVVPLKEVGGQMVRGITRKVSQAYGTTPDLLPTAGLRVARGRYLTQTDLDEASNVCVIGSEVVKAYFKLEDALGQTIRIDEKVFTVVGILEPVGLAGGAGALLVGRDLDNDMHVPITAARTMFGDMIVRSSTGSIQFGEVQISEIYLVSPTRERVMPDARRAMRIMATRHSRLEDYTIKVPYELLENAERTALQYKIVFGFVAGIALLVGGIGIMNIMLATVTERTREIGIRRALGATKRHILLQFLVETSVISTTGGLLGIALGVGGSVGLDWLVPMLPKLPYVGHMFPANAKLPTAITLGAVLLAFSVAVIIGLVFGIYPARRAAAQDPIVALRHE
jgi:putative ABC transport system permease protein